MVEKNVCQTLTRIFHCSILWIKNDFPYPSNDIMCNKVERKPWLFWWLDSNNIHNIRIIFISSHFLDKFVLTLSQIYWFLSCEMSAWFRFHIFECHLHVFVLFRCWFFFVLFSFFFYFCGGDGDRKRFACYEQTE